MTSTPDTFFNPMMRSSSICSSLEGNPALWHAITTIDINSTPCLECSPIRQQHGNRRLIEFFQYTKCPICQTETCLQRHPCSANGILSKLLITVDAFPTGSRAPKHQLPFRQLIDNFPIISIVVHLIWFLKPMAPQLRVAFFEAQLYFCLFQPDPIDPRIWIPPSRQQPVSSLTR